MLTRSLKSVERKNPSVRKISGATGMREKRLKTTIIIPTYNEAENIRVLLTRLSKALDAHLDRREYEIIIVDDNSPDGTARVAEETGENLGLSSNLKIIVRKKERGLSTAVIEGIKHARGEYIVVMDADLQHPPEKVPELLRELEKGNDIVIATRYRGGADKGLGLFRKLVSFAAGLAAKLLLPQARLVSDPMTGFFGIRRKVVEGRLDLMNPKGFKVLLEILVKGNYNPKRISEIPYVFGKRMYGESKLGLKEIINYLHHLLKLNDYRILKFAMVGTTGIAVNEGLLYATHYVFRLPLYAAGAISIEASILSNFTLNSIYTFRKVKTSVPLAKRILRYHLATAVGVTTNYAVLLILSYLLGVEPLIANLIGIFLGFIANYTLSEHYVWQRIGGEP